MPDTTVHDRLLACLAQRLGFLKSQEDIVLCVQALSPSRRHLVEEAARELLAEHANAEACLRAVSGPEEAAPLTDYGSEAGGLGPDTADDPEDGPSGGAGPGMAERDRYEFRESRDAGRKGGQGIVRKAFDRVLKREVAVKELHPRAAEDRERFKTRFRAEIEVTARLDHPSIVPIYGMWEDSTGSLFCAMRYVDGATLERAVQDYHAEPPGQEKVLHFQRLLNRYLAACYALAYAHDRGVLHRDVKPSNIMLGNFGETVVLDWGLAVPLATVGAAAGRSGDAAPVGLPPDRTEGLGTRGYASPEQQQGQRSLLGPASDVFSLGATLYHLLTGVAPLPVASPDDPPPAAPRAVNAEVPEELSRICLRALAPRPQDRYPAVEGLIKDVAQWFAGSDRARGLLVALPQANLADLPPLLDEVEKLRYFVEDDLEEQAARLLSPEARLRLDLARLRLGAVEPGPLLERLLQARPQDFAVLRDEFGRHREGLCPRLWHVAGDRSADADVRLHAAAALAEWDPASPSWDQADEGRLGTRIVARLVTENLLHVGIWAAALNKARRWLLAPLKEVFRPDSVHAADERAVATSVLTDYLRDEPAELAELAPRGAPTQAATILSALEPHRERVLPVLRSYLSAAPGAAGAVGVREAATAAAALLRLADPEWNWALLDRSRAPDLRSLLIHHLAPLQVPPQPLARRLVDTATAAPIRAALLQALGEYAATVLPDELRGPLQQSLARQYVADPDPEVHASIAWLFRRWGWGEDLPTLTPGGRPRPGEAPTWIVMPAGVAMTVIPGPVKYQRSSPPEEVGREWWHELRHEVRIARSFALAEHMVTAADFERFREEQDWPARESQPPRCPVVNVGWYDAAAYCNALSMREGLPEEQWAYPPLEVLRQRAASKEGPSPPMPPMPLPPSLARAGYRLPTDAEWEYACRAGTETSRFFGDGDELLPFYGWFLATSGRRQHDVGLLKPNPLGLFDLYGNALEWCHNRHRSYKQMTQDERAEDGEERDPVQDGVQRGLRGGSHEVAPDMCRSAYRHWYGPELQRHNVGFRVARTVHPS